MASVEYEPGTALPDLTDEERVLFWRAEAFERAGYDEDAVLRLALAKTVDLHTVRLLERGCSPSTALRILL